MLGVQVLLIQEVMEEVVMNAHRVTADDVEKLARNSFMAALMDDAASSDYLERFTGKVFQLRAF